MREFLKLSRKNLGNFDGIANFLFGKINTENINFTYKKYFLLHKTSIELLFCKATNIIAEIQRVGNPKRPSK